MKLFVEYMKKLMDSKGGQQNPTFNSIMQQMNKQNVGMNKPVHQAPRMNQMNPMMGQMNMNIPLMQTKSQGMQGQNMRPPNMMNMPPMNPMMNPMMMNQPMSNPR